jgi:hypothetical protein
MVGEILTLTPVDLLVGKPQTWRLKVTVKQTYNIGSNFGEEIGAAVR